MHEIVHCVADGARWDAHLQLEVEQLEDTHEENKHVCAGQRNVARLQARHPIKFEKTKLNSTPKNELIGLREPGSPASRLC